VNQLAEDGAAATDAVAMARRFDELSASVASIKQAHLRGLESGLDSHLDYEADTQGWLQQRPDFTEATRAFVEKRPPRLAERTPPVRTT
jgi:2-(1,2-epoxy-1,2-dihydrophenyl)acetyl-CoA isomerase